MGITRERKAKRAKPRIIKGVCECVCGSAYELSFQSFHLSSGELLTVTGSFEWIAKVPVFRVTSAAEKAEGKEQDEEEC